MGTYYKPQSPIQSGEDFIYPITTADQVKVNENTRLNAVAVYLENINNSTDTTVYGNNATTLGGVAAEDYALKTDTAPDSSKLGGKAPEYYIQPRNLLDNSDFRNPVNQRGKTSYTAEGYTIDRWNINANLSSLAVNDGYITATAKPSVNSFFRQYLESKLLFGKTVTFAVKVKDGDLLIASGQYLSSDPTSEETIALKASSEINIYINAQPNRAALQIRINNGSTANLEWAALYEGSYTADTLPPYVPKGYAAEFAECQRYYYTIKSDGAGYAAYATGVMNDASSAYFPIVFPIPMRIAPTLSYSGNFRVYVNGSGRSITNMENDQQSRYSSRILIYNISGGVLGQACELQSGGDRTAFIAFSADL